MSNWSRKAGVVSPASKPASSHPKVADSPVPSAAISSSVFVSVSGTWTAFPTTVIPSVTRSCGAVVVSQSSATAKSHAPYASSPSRGSPFASTSFSTSSARSPRVSAGSEESCWFHSSTSVPLTLAARRYIVIVCIVFSFLHPFALNLNPFSQP